MTTNRYSKKHPFFRIFYPFILLLPLLGLISCSNLLPDCNVCSSPPLVDLNGKWELVRWNLPPNQSGQIRLRNIPSNPEGPSIAMMFDPSQKILSGFSGCNQFSSKLTEDSKGAIVIGHIALTRKMCAENQRMEFERDLMNILTDYRSWKQQHHQLLLIARTGDVLLFERHSPSK